MTTRSVQLNRWLAKQLDDQPYDLVALAGDASTRSYSRVSYDNKTAIMMDAPPNSEKNLEFVHLAKALAAKGLHVPELMAVDFHQGFLLISDLGDDLYSTQLNPETADGLYADALFALTKMSRCAFPKEIKTVDFDAFFIKMECERTWEWFFAKFLNFPLSKNMNKIFEEVMQLMIANNASQPQVFTHRDYHCRNLLKTADNNPGVIDFQDAVIGPITYDLVSILKDCYIDWPIAQQKIWVARHLDLLLEQRLLKAVSFEQFWRWYELTGLQRHIKVLGIFARLYLRDNLAHFVQDLPRVMNYILQVASYYPELANFHRIFSAEVAECFQNRLQMLSIDWQPDLALAKGA